MKVRMDQFKWVLRNAVRARKWTRCHLACQACLANRIGLIFRRDDETNDKIALYEFRDCSVTVVRAATMPEVDVHWKS